MDSFKHTIKGKTTKTIKNVATLEQDCLTKLANNDERSLKLHLIGHKGVLAPYHVYFV